MQRLETALTNVVQGVRRAVSAPSAATWEASPMHSDPNIGEGLDASAKRSSESRFNFRLMVGEQSLDGDDSAAEPFCRLLMFVLQRGCAWSPSLTDSPD